VQDTYSPTNVAYLLPIKVTTPTNVIVLWTNMQREFDCGNWSAPSNGNYNFKMAVTGKNSSSSGYVLTTDFIKLVPASVVASTNNPPLTPANLIPISSATNQLTSPTLQASTFVDPDSGDTQSASEWLVQETNNSVVFDSGTDTVDKTSIMLPAGTLNLGDSYNWQVRYQDNHGEWSDYSAATIFSTAAPAVATSSSANGLAIAWPTNSDGFVLEYATNLPASTWTPVGIAPAIVNGMNVVTNLPGSGNMFFRLDKP
jgi:hypothetical protein